MTFGEYILVASIVILFFIFIINVCRMRPTDGPDTFLCNCCGLIFTFFILISIFVQICQEPVVINTKIVRFWNRSTYDHSKAGRQITEWRKPDITLSAQEYLMGVELSKSNSCNYFDFGNQADIKKFKRCAYFFPEMLTEYIQHHQVRTGVILNTGNE
jgi:hypothetical protein